MSMLERMSAAVGRCGGLIIICCLGAGLVCGCGQDGATDDGTGAANTDDGAAAKSRAAPDTAARVAAGAAAVSGVPTGDAATDHPRISSPGPIRVVLTWNGESAESAPAGDIAALLIADHQGRRTGFFARTGQTLAEIPTAAYYDEYIEAPGEEGAGAAWWVLEINRPEIGAYELSVQGIGAGTYDLSLRSYDADGNPLTRELSGVPIRSGLSHAFVLQVNNVRGSEFVVSGRYAGDGQEEAAAEQLLTYANVDRDTTRFDSATDACLLIFYGQAVDPGTLRADLNGGDVSDLFSPLAGSGQLVRLPLRAGENVLVVSIAPSLPSGQPDVRDTDRLVLVIEE